MILAPKRRWFQWSLLTLFVVVTVAALCIPAIPVLIAKYREWEKDRGWVPIGEPGTIEPFENNLE